MRVKVLGVFGTLAGLLAGCGGGYSSSSTYTPPPDVQAQGFEIGSGNVAVADPTLPRPNVTPCAVPLFSNYTFNGFSSQSFNYAPPSGCSGPWSKIVLEADFSVTVGRQFDRTAHISIGGVNLYTGTTQEPSKTVAPAWHVERDLTEYAPLFASAQQGYVDLDNIVNATYTGIPSGSARILFYPAPTAADAGNTADAVYAMTSGANGRPVNLNDGKAAVSLTQTFPTNVVRAYLEVIAQSQSNDEFWYTCAPDSLANPLQTCGSTAFRETQISVDGVPAGVAPVYPWIYTGGMDPGLWRNIPDVQALNMQPYRVDLSPFAGVLNDGKPHTIAVGVQNANQYFSVLGTLFIYRDSSQAIVTGGITANTLVAPVAPTINNQVTFDSSGNPSGTLGTTSSRNFQVSGYINSSHGREQLDVVQSMAFSNVQTFTATTQQFVQSTDVDTDSIATIGNNATHLRRVHHYPLSLNFVTDSSSHTTTTAVASTVIKNRLWDARGLWYGADVRNGINNVSIYPPASSGTTARSGSQRFQFFDTRGSCFDRTLTSTNLLLVSAIDTGACGGAGSIGRMPWFVDPQGGTGFIGAVGY